MIEVILNDAHYAGALAEALSSCHHRLLIATATLKNVFIPTAATGRRGRGARSIVDVFAELGKRGVEVRLLHSGVPSESLLAQLKAGGVPANFTMRRCPRLHAKAVIVDGRQMYLGSANLTGAGLGAKSAPRRNFEAGIWTDDVALIDPVADMLESVWTGAACAPCGRKEHCPVPLEEPEL